MRTVTDTGMSVDPLLAVKWYPELLRVRTATGAAEEGEAKPPVAPAAEEKPASLGTLRGLDLPKDLEKPVLVYFHWPHEDGDKGKRVVKFCSGPLDDESFVRVTSLFHCVEVNTRDSEARLVDEAKVKATPSIMVCRPDATILWRTEETGMSGKALGEALKTVLREKFPEAWEAVQKEITAQKKNLAEARRLLGAGKREDAIMALNLVVGSDVRFTETWSEGVKALREQEKKAAEEEKAKAGK
jgi:hypothetical protein